MLVIFYMNEQLVWVIFAERCCCFQHFQRFTQKDTNEFARIANNSLLSFVDDVISLHLDRPAGLRKPPGSISSAIGIKEAE